MDGPLQGDAKRGGEQPRASTPERPPRPRTPSPRQPATLAAIAAPSASPLILDPPQGRLLFALSKTPSSPASNIYARASRMAQDALSAPTRYTYQRWPPARLYGHPTGFRPLKAPFPTAIRTRWAMPQLSPLPPSNSPPKPIAARPRRITASKTSPKASSQQCPLPLPRSNFCEPPGPFYGL